MSPTGQSARRQAGGLNALKNNPTLGECETPNRPYMRHENEETKTVYFIRPRCKQWSCVPCAARRARLWVYIANYGGSDLLSQNRNCTFLTLTSHRNVRTLAGGVLVWRRAWPKLSARWRRAQGGLEYLYIPEHVVGFNFHVHFITTATLPVRWYKDNGAETGLGYQANAKKIAAGKQCGGYVAKYLGKALANMDYPKYFRRVNTSRGWPRPPDPESELVWESIGSKLAKVIYSVELYTERGWEVSHSLEELDWRT